MKIILHCGGPKTGTTSIQKALKSAAPNLLKHGVLYPDTTIANAAHHALVGAVSSDEQLNGISPLTNSIGTGKAGRQQTLDFLQKLRKTITEHDPQIVILSTEFALPISEEMVFELKKLLTTFTEDIHVVVYVREPVAWWASFAQQNIRMGRPVNYQLFPIRRHLETWRTHHDQMQVRAFDRLLLTDGDIVADFLVHCVGINDLEKVVPTYRENELMSAEICEIIWTIRNLAFPEFSGKPLPLTQSMITRLQEIEKRTEEQSKLAVRKELRASIASRATDFCWLREIYGITFSGLNYEEIGGTDPLEKRQDMSVRQMFEVNEEQRDALIGKYISQRK